MKTKRRAGEFSATCKIGEDGNDRELAFTDAALFEEHMLAAHGAKPGHWIRERTREPGVRLAPPSWTSLAVKVLRLGRGNWKPPRLTEEGTHFEPKEFAPGDVVGWKDAIGIMRSGEVWSAGYRQKSIWVIPFETLPNEAAVLLVQAANGRLVQEDTARRSVRKVAEPAS